MSEQCDDRMMKEHERNLAAAASRTQIGALPAEDARKLVLLIQRYRIEAVPSRGGGGGIGSLRGSVRYGFNNSAGKPIQFGPLVLPPVAAKRIIIFAKCATRCPVVFKNQAVGRWLGRWVRRRRRDDHCDSFAVRK